MWQRVSSSFINCVESTWQGQRPSWRTYTLPPVLVVSLLTYLLHYLVLSESSPLNVYVSIYFFFWGLGYDERLVCHNPKCQLMGAIHFPAGALLPTGSTYFPTGHEMKFILQTLLSVWYTPCETRALWIQLLPSNLSMKMILKSENPKRLI